MAEDEDIVSDNEKGVDEKKAAYFQGCSRVFILRGNPHLLLVIFTCIIFSF